jgi:hypothetical protein
MKRRRYIFNVPLRAKSGRKVSRAGNERSEGRNKNLKHILDIFDDRGFSHNADPPARGESSEERRE